MASSRTVFAHVVLVGCLYGFGLPSRAQIPLKTEQFRVFDKQGQPAQLAQVVESCQKADVLFLGEEHNDAVGHAVETELFKQVASRYRTSRSVALSLEMFERDTQTVVDEYLKGLITPAQFLTSSRPWPNYATDYAPLVELAKSNALPVIAANAPRRYTNIVSRNGREALNALSPHAKTWLAPLPYPRASAAYSQKFNALMAGMHSPKFLDAQALWDATMADSIRIYVEAHKNPLVVHLSGKFHSESNLGTVEFLKGYRPTTKTCVVSIFSTEGFPKFDASLKGLADFIVLTDPRVKRSDEVADTKASEAPK